MPKIEKIIITENIALINLAAAPADMCFCATLFDALSGKGVNVDMISQNPPQGSFSPMSFTISEDDLEGALAVIAELRGDFPDIKISVSGGSSKLLISSPDMRENPGFAARVFKAAALCGADIRMVTTSETEISLLLCDAHADIARENIERIFEEI